MVGTSSSTENLDETPGVVAQRLHAEQIMNEPNDNSDDFGDPDPPPANATSEQKLEYSRTVQAYSKEILEHLEGIPDLQGEDVWIEFTCSFRKQTIRAMTSTQTIDWCRLLCTRGVSVTHKRGTSRWKALQNCLEATEFIPNDSLPDDKTVHVQFNDKQPNLKDKSQSDEIIEKVSIDTQKKVHKDAGKPVSNENLRTSGDSTSNSTFSRRGPLEALMRAYSHQTKYSGSFVEDFEGAVEQFDTICGMLELSEEDKSKGFPIMLSGAAFAHYSRQFAKKDRTYKELIDAFRAWYTSEEQKKRLLNIWQTPSLTRELQTAPDKSELEVFQTLADKLVRVQNQLHSDYHQDRFLRDQLIRAVDLPHIQHSLNDKVPNTAQEAMHRIANRLSAEPKSAGANIAQEEDDHANYGLNMRFGGQAKKHLKGSNPRFSKKKKLSRLLASAKGCYVCGKDHRARQVHNPKEILEAIEKIKRENPTALFSIDEVMDVQYALAAISSADEMSEEESQVDDEEMTGANFVSLNSEDELGQETQNHLANVAFIHGRTFASDLQKEMMNIEAALSVGETPRFNGIVLDTGANRSSVMSLDQYKAYCREFRVPMRIDGNDKRNIVGLGSRNRTIGTAVITIPFYNLNLWIDVTFRILKTNCPSLLCLKDMIQNGLDISIQNQTISFKHKIQTLTFENFFLIHRWGPYEMSFYTEPELKRLHRVFGHPSVTALKHLLQRADRASFDEDVKKALHDITRECMTCARHASKPRRFKITVGTDDLRFNHILAVDIMYINSKPVIHVVDEATHYQAALFLRRVTAEETWKAILKCWIRVYLGPPDHLRIDQGSQFVSNQFKSSAQAEGITLLEAPIECPSTMSNVERYHGPLRSAYNKVRESLPRTESDADCLQIAVKATNDTLGPEGLCPTLLVYGTLPRPLRRTPAESQLRRAEAIDAAAKEVLKQQAKRKIAFALRHPGGPKAKEQEKDLQRLPAGAPVLIYREKSKKWEGPYPFINVDGSTVVVQLPKGRKIFRSNVVKSVNAVKDTWCNTDGDDEERVETHQNEKEKCLLGHTDMRDKDATENVFFVNHCESDEVCDSESSHSEDIFGDLLHAMFGSENVTYMKPSKDHSFVESRKAEIQGLLDRKTFEVTNRDSVPKGTRIYGTRWVDCMKKVNGKEKEKSRLVAQNYRDKGETGILTKSPTISRMGQRVAVATASLMPAHTSYVRDISQAYLQADTKLERLIYLKAPPEMGLKEDQLLLAKKPLYGIPESGLHWFATYQRHHIEQLGMKACKSDPCMLFQRTCDEEEGLSALTVLQVDDAYGHCNKRFLDMEEEQSSRFLCKPRKVLQAGESAQFNGVRITVNQNGSHTVDQTDKLKKLKAPSNKEELVRARAQIQYIASCTRPDLCAAVQLMAAEVTNPDNKTFKKMQDIIAWCHETETVGLRFVPLETKSLRLALFTDASFANANKNKSQISFAIVLTDGTGTANILHYGSSACRRVTRSVMAAELLALVYGYDNAFLLKHMLTEVLGRTIPVDAYVDSKTVFDVVAKKGPTLEKRLQIDAFAIRESHENRELRSLAWIEGKQNIADGLTKGLIDSKHPLWRLMITNKLYLKPQGWVEESESNAVQHGKKKNPGV